MSGEAIETLKIIRQMRAAPSCVVFLKIYRSLGQDLHELIERITQTKQQSPPFNLVSYLYMGQELQTANL